MERSWRRTSETLSGRRRGDRSDDRAGSRAVRDRGCAAINSHVAGRVQRGDRNSWELIDDHNVSDLTWSRSRGRDADVPVCEGLVMLNEDVLGEMLMTDHQIWLPGWRPRSQRRRRRPS